MKAYLVTANKLDESGKVVPDTLTIGRCFVREYDAAKFVNAKNDFDKDMTYNYEVIDIES